MKARNTYEQIAMASDAIRLVEREHYRYDTSKSHFAYDVALLRCAAEIERAASESGINIAAQRASSLLGRILAFESDEKTRAALLYATSQVLALREHHLPVGRVG